MDDLFQIFAEPLGELLLNLLVEAIAMVLAAATISVWQNNERAFVVLRLSDHSGKR